MSAVNLNKNDTTIADSSAMNSTINIQSSQNNERPSIWTSNNGGNITLNQTMQQMNDETQMPRGSIYPTANE